MSPRHKFGFLTLMASTMLILMIVGLVSVGKQGLQSNVVAQGVQPGDGLTGTYYGNPSFTNPVLIRVDDQIDFELGFNSPAPEVPADFYSVRWTGQIRAEQTGTYTFFTQNDDGAVLKIDNQVIINDPNIHAPVTNQGVFEMTAGERYDIQLDYFEWGGNVLIKLEYEGPQTPRQIIPKRVLYSKVTQCSDKVDNDGDGLIDVGQDPGCEDANDNDERDANCADGIDNDGDGKIDFPEDPGCDSSSDGDETDPISNVNVNLNTGTDTISGDNSYPLGIEANAPNNIFVRARVGNRFEMVRMNATLLPSFEGTVKTASIHSYLLRGTDSEGKEHLAVVKGRYWSPSSFADQNVTSDPWYSYFTVGGDIATCADEMKARFSAVPFYLDNPFFFQQMLEMLSLCQRGPSGATPTTPRPTTTTAASAPTTSTTASTGTTATTPTTSGVTTGTAASPTLGTTLANPVLTPTTPTTSTSTSTSTSSVTTTSSSGTLSIPFSNTTSPTGITPTTLTSPTTGTLLPKTTLNTVFSLGGGASNKYHYIDLIDVPDFTLPATSCLEYDIQTTNTNTRIAVDLKFSDSSSLRDTGVVDLDGIPAHPASSLTTLSFNQFHHRIIPLAVAANKTIQKYNLAAEFDTVGSQSAQFKDIKITDCSGVTLQQIFFADTPRFQVDITSDQSNTATLIAQ